MSLHIRRWWELWLDLALALFVFAVFAATRPTGWGLMIAGAWVSLLTTVLMRTVKLSGQPAPDAVLHHFALVLVWLALVLLSIAGLWLLLAGFSQAGWLRPLGL